MNEVDNTNTSTHRDDDEIINKPILENRYELTVQFCNMVFKNEYGNRIMYEETKDFINSNFPIRKLIVSVNDKDIVNILNFKKDENDMVDVTILVSFDKDSNIIQNKPFEDGKFKGLIQNGDFNIPLNEITDDYSDTKSSDVIYSREVIIYLFREDELNCFDNDDINFLVSGTNLKSLLSFLFLKYTNYQLILSPPDHNPSINRLLLPQSNLLEILKIIDLDMGIFFTNYILFINEGVLYFLNTDNDVKCRNDKLEFSINLLVSRPGKDLRAKYVDKLNNGNYTISVDYMDVKVTKDDEYKINESLNYIFPNGKKYKNKNMLSRNVHTIRKITNIQPLIKYRNRTREDIEFSINNIAVKDINPLSTIFYTDSQNKRREYRVSKVKTTIVSSQLVEMKIKAYRLVGGEINEV